MNNLAVAVAVALFGVIIAVPNLRVERQADDSNSIERQLGLPSNSSSIRPNLVDTFSCEGRIYGYYGDRDNDCQVFHICYPVSYPDGREEMIRWSFICPEETIFDQSNLVCVRPEDAVPCEEVESFYTVNENFGVTTQRPLN